MSYDIYLSVSDLSITISGFIHVAANGIILFFLGLNSIPLYMYHIFFIHSSAYGSSGRFHVLAVVSSAAVNVGPHVSFWTIFFSGHMLNCGIAG